MLLETNSMMAALQTYLQNSSSIVGSGYTIEIGAPINDDQLRAPWIGLWPAPVEITADLTGDAKPWRAEHQINLYLQEFSDLGSGDATIRLTTATRSVLESVGSYHQLGGLALHLNQVALIPYGRDEEIDQQLLTNLLVLTYDVRL